MVISRHRIFVAALCGILMAIQVSAAYAAPRAERHATKPAGSNGIVKIASHPIDRSPSNEPHVSCVFDLEYFSYGEGELWAEHDIWLHPPTGRRHIVEGMVFTGEDRARGGRDHDATVTVDIAQALAVSGVDSHDKQGWHLKLTVRADGSRGSDVKHKVFWVRCARTAVAAAAARLPDRTAVEGRGRNGVAGSAAASRVLGEEAHASERKVRAAGTVAPVRSGPGALTSARTLIPALLGIALLVSGVVLGVRLRRATHPS